MRIKVQGSRFRGSGLKGSRFRGSGFKGSALQLVEERPVNSNKKL